VGGLVAVAVAVAGAAIAWLRMMIYDDGAVGVVVDWL
jgi:hypothetical protein